MDRINFIVNGRPYSVGSDVDSEVTLNDYLRKHLNLRGTKYMCREGGCGACCVSVTAPDTLTEQKKTFSVNSCLVSITSCKDWEITTIEGIGHRAIGYHTLQKTWAKYNASQCGYCSPGWVMNMYSLTESKGKMKQREIEDSFGSNTCRCTGYRPILDALKSFASDVNEDNNNMVDIEDLSNICKRTGRLCSENSSGCESDDWCVVQDNKVEQNTIIEIVLKDNRKWYRVKTIDDIFTVFDKEPNNMNSYMLISGNTAKGPYPIENYPNVLIDISGVKELKGNIIDQNLIIGAGSTLIEAEEIFKQTSNQEYFEYLDKFYRHMQLVAHIPVKNIGTIAGNLMTKHKYKDFPSDLFLLFETVGANITLQSKNGKEVVALTDFLNIDMKGKVIRNILLPPLSQEYSLVTYKIMPRSQNAHALVNAGYLYQIKNDKITDAFIVYGGLSSNFIHAERTEQYLIDKNPFNNTTLQNALQILKDELVIDGNPPKPSVEYRKKVALGLFYKGLLELCPPTIVKDIYKSAILNLRFTRPVSQGRQTYETNEAIWPLNKPMPKVEALIQSSGEAMYVDDIQTMTNEVYASYVLSTIASGDIDAIDASEALAMKGVVAFYSAKDIPGTNSFTPPNLVSVFIEEEALCGGKIKYFNQPIGIIVAESEKLAHRAAKMVKVTYKNVQKPILTIKEAKKHLTRVIILIALPATSTGLNIKKKISGSASIGTQIHYTMETQVCVTVPSDDGLDIYPSTQWMDLIHVAISKALLIEQSRINLSVKRVGGAFGAKVTRASQVAVGCSLVTYLLNRPCRFILPMTTNFRALGKRSPCTADYLVTVSATGEIQSLLYNIYEDNGYTINEPIALLGFTTIKNCYSLSRWTVTVFNVITDTPKNTWARAPGSLEQIGMIEIIFEHISYETSQDPIDVRLANLHPDNEIIKEVFQSIRKDADYDNRKALVKKFNATNRWKKRGLRFAPLKWPIPLVSLLSCSLTVYQGDGSVVITHGGIELGQGIHTKVAQVCAYTLNIPIEKIKVKASNVITNPNSDLTAGSVTSESACYGIVKCCQIILDRLAPIKISLGDVVWEVLVKTAHMKGVNLMATYTVTPSDQKHYYVYGATITEVEVDMLTGETQVLRVDLLEDVGQSLSPDVDVGQIEGAFIMGLGYWMCENVILDINTGEMLTDRSWNYHVPLAKDIPIDFRVYFRHGSFNEDGVLGSKATGEPAIIMSISVAFAIREAIVSVRADKGIPTTEWFNMDGPCTNENIILWADTRIEDYKFN